MQQSAINIFYSYSHKDDELRRELETHLAIPRRQGVIKEWHDRKIEAGKEWENVIDSHFEEADLILLLISPDFIATDYCYGKEMRRALEKHEANQAVVVPIIILPADWQNAPFSKLQALPKDALAVTTWADRDEAWLNVASRIRDTVGEISKKKKRSIQPGLTKIGNHIIKEFDRLERAVEKKGQINGISTGYLEVDEMIDGLHPTDFVVIASRSLMGKTDFAINIATNLAVSKNRTPVAIFSMKLSSDQITRRIICSTSHLSYHHQLRGIMAKAEWAKITAAAGKLVEAPLYIDENPSLTVPEIISRARKIKEQHGLGLIVIDSLQNLSGIKHEGASTNIPAITQSLKALTKELETPLIATSQLSPNLERRIDKRPKMQDFGDWESLNEYADVIAFIYRDEVYHPDPDNSGIAEIILAKNLSGWLGAAKVAYIPSWSLFANLESKGTM